MKTLICFAFLVFCLRAHSQTNTSIRPQILDLPMTIAISNRIVAIGERTSIQCSVTNQFTNSFCFVWPDQTHIFVVDEIGQTNDLLNGVFEGSRHTQAILKPAENYHWSVPIKFNTNFTKGNYKLLATIGLPGCRQFFGWAVSDPLEIELKPLLFQVVNK